MADADFNVKAIISAQTSQFEKGIKNAQSSINTMSKSIEGVQKLLKSAFSIVGIGVSIKAVTDFGRSCVQSATQAQKAFNILDNTIKATGADAWTSTKEMDQLAKSLSDSTNYAVTEIEEMQSVLLGFRNITGDTFGEASEAVMDMATVMGMDLKSATQVVGKALDDPIKGLDSLRRQGFQFTEEQKAELTQLVKNGKQLEAQKIILNELANSYGGAAKAGQDSFARQRHAVENFSDTLGGKLIPVMQVFAENSAKTLNNLTNLISNMDFTPIVNVVTNLSKIFSSTFEKISNYLRSVKDEVSDFISRFNFKPIISILDTFAGVFITVFDRIKSRFNESSEMMNQLKESLIDFSNSEMFQKIVDVINTIIDAIVFLWGEIERVAGEIRAFVVGKVIEIWNKIKELFQNSQDALANSESDIKSWGDYFYSIFNNIFRIAQDLINSVSALLNGDWQVAWEYAKLAVLRVAESVATTLESIKNGFKDKMQEMLGIASLAVKFLPGGMGIALSAALKGLEGLTNTSSKMRSVIQEQVEETENKIQELTGHTADIAIKDLQGVSSKFAGFTSNALGAIEDLTNGVATETEKQKKYFSSATSSGESSYKAFSEWDSKLLQQRLEDLSDWSDEAHEINLQLIEEERKKALEADKTGADTEKINKYYNRKIEQENERSEKAKRDMIKQTALIVINQLKTIASNTIIIFKKVISTIKNIFSTIENFIKNIFSKVKNIFSTLFEFNIDDALNNLLKIEDAILTFFVETLPNLPFFFESAFSSVLVLVQTLMNSIDWEEVKGFLDSMVKTFVTYAPRIVEGITTIFTNLLSTISEVLVENSPEITKVFGDMFFGIIESLPKIIGNVIDVIVEYISNIGKYFADNAQKLSDDLTAIIKSIIDAVVRFIKSGGWRNILQGLLAIQKAIENAIADNMEEIAQAIEDMLPDLVQTLIDSIVSASQTLGKIAKTLLPLVAKIITAIVDVITSNDVINSSIEAIEGVIEGLIPAIVELLVNALPKIINFFLLELPSYTPKLVTGIVKGLVKGFTKVNWGQVVSDIFTGFINAVMSLFGIHSPSTLFEGFGTNMVEGLINGLKGITDAVSGILNGLLSAVTNIFNNISSNVTSVFNNLFSNLTNITSNIFSNITSSFSSLTSSVTSVLNSLMSQVNNLTSQLLNVPIPGLSGSGGGSSGSGSSGGGYIGQGTIVDPNPASNPLTKGLVETGKKAAEAVKKFFGFEIGTQQTPKGLALVGEAGPELVNFKGGEQVLNAHNTQKALEGMGGKTINQSITFNNLQDTTAFAMMQQMKQYNRALAINGII